MKNKVFNFICVLSFCFSLISCGLKPEDRTAQEEANDRAELNELYKPLEGKYVGYIYATQIGASDDIPIEITVFTTEEQSGVNEKGEPIFRPSLQARFNRLDLLQDGTQDRVLNVRLYKETNEMTMKNESNKDDMLSITGKYDSRTNKISGMAYDKRGPMGPFEVVRKR